MPRSIVALLLGCLTMAHGAARADQIYSAGETFSEPELGLVLDIQAGDEAAARKKIAAGLDLDQPVAPPATFDFKRIFGLSPLQRKRADALTPAPSGGRADETLTILNFFIANDDLPAIRLALKLGANPNAKGSFYFDSFRFASEFERADALDILLQAIPFSKMTDAEQARRLADLPKIKTVNHWLSETEYRLDPTLLRVASKYHPNFNLQMPERGGGTLLTSNMSLSGYETVLWLLENSEVDARLPDGRGRTVASITAEWLRGVKADDRHRKMMLLKIKDALATKGIPVD
jgi:hypothetical protein